jgi:hypothetical protein
MTGVSFSRAGALTGDVETNERGDQRNRRGHGNSHRASSVPEPRRYAAFGVDFEDLQGALLIFAARSVLIPLSGGAAPDGA